MTTNEEHSMFILIGNIPLSFHTPDLRNFFSYSIEKEAFVCFNYRHRPHSSGKFNVCICKIKSNKFDELLNMYDKKTWIDSRGRLVALKCTIVKIKLNKTKSDVENNQLSESDISDLLEFKKIPHWMPNGNVGTPTKVFIEYINQCIMPQSLITKLGLDLKSFKKYKKRIYSNVEYDYNQVYYIDDENKNEDSNQKNDEPNISVAMTANGVRIDQNIDDEKLIKEINYSKEQEEKEKILKENKKEDDEEGDDLENELEDWERHEALHDDVTKQDRTSPYFFENEIELKWEKGGSGLVFYTDNNFWKDYEDKDFDAETADDFDVDMSVYYEANGGDKDAQDILDMRRQTMLRNGESDHLFDDKNLHSKTRMNPFKERKLKIGSFEKYTKGLGRKILEKQGWKEGEPVGNPKRSGLREALDASDGKQPNDKTGFGYHGVKLDRGVLIEQQKLKREQERRSQPFYIGSKYDQDLTKSDSLLTRFEPVIKYRQNPS